MTFTLGLWGADVGSRIPQMTQRRPQAVVMRSRAIWSGFASSRGSCRDSSYGQERRRRGLQVVCMASERRVARVGKQIEREVSILLQGDKVVQNAICPERQSGYDSALSAMASVTEVALSTDLQVAKVYLSIYSDNDGKATAMKALAKLQGYVRSRLAHQMQMRMVPEIRFIIDDAAERGEQVLALLQKIKRQDAGEEAMPPVTLPRLPENEPAKASGKSGKSKGKKDDQPADGFLDLDDDDWFDDDFLEDEEEDSEEDEDFDNTDAVVEAYLAGSGGGSAFDEFEEPVLAGGGGEKGGRRSQRRRKYKGKG